MPNRALLAALGGALLLSTAGAHAQVQLRIAGNFPEDHTATGAMEIFKEEVEQITDGGIQVDLFPAMQLGGAQENVDQVRSGAIFGVFTSIAYFSRSVPEYEAVSLPFLFDSREQAFALMDGEVGDYLDAKMADEGFVNMGYMELGFRHVTNDVRPITTLADFDGLKIRLQPNEVHLESMRAVGANPTPMDISEVYSALQQGVLDGQENPYNIIATRGFDEVQTYLSDSGHFFDFINAVANKERFGELSAENQKAVREAMRTAVLWQREEAAAQEEKFREILIERDMQFDPISDDVRAELREATAGVVDGLRERIGDEPIDLVLANIES